MDCKLEIDLDSMLYVILMQMAPASSRERDLQSLVTNLQQRYLSN